MTVVRIFFFLSIVSVLAATGHASATITTEHLTDTELVALMTENAFCAEGRIGDLLGAATFELDVGSEHGNPAQTAQYGWPNGEPVPFILTYDHIAKTASFTVGGITLVYSPEPPFTEIFVRARAVNDGSSMIVYDIVLDGVPITDYPSTSGPDGADTLWIKGGALADGFTLTGVALMTWTGSPPTQSRLAFQVKPSALSTISTENASWGQVKVFVE